MFAPTIAPRSAARTCVLLGGSGQNRPLTEKPRPLAALLRPLSFLSGTAQDVADEPRPVRS